MFFVFALICVVFLSIYARSSQYEVWLKNKDTFFVDNTPIMSSVDTYKYIGYAKDIETKSNFDEKVFYPDKVESSNNSNLLSIILYYFSRITGIDYYNSAIYLTIILSSLFIIPLCIYFFVIGYPIAGIFGSLTATFAPIYFARTSIGRFDTDILNLFFLFLASCLILFTEKTKKVYQIFIYSALLGVTVNLLYLLENNITLNLLYGVILFVFLKILKLNIKNILLSILIYFIFSNPLYFYEIFSESSLIATISSPIDNVRETLKGLLTFVSLNYFVAIVGLLFFIIFFVTHLKIALPLTPIIILGATSFFNNTKSTIYLGAFVGIGFGYFLTLLSSYLSNKMKLFQKIKDKKSFYEMFVFAFGLFVLFIVSIATISSSINWAYSYVPNGAVNKNIYNLFLEMKNKLPANSIIYSWWDYGLAISDITGFKVFDSGLKENTIKTKLIAKSFYGNQSELFKIISYLNNKGISDIKSIKDIDNIGDNYNEKLNNDNIYLLITYDMIEKFYPISAIATYDTEKNISFPESYLPLVCSSIDNNKAICSGMEIDLLTGSVDNESSYVDSITYTNNGKESKFSSFKEKSQINLMINYIDNMYFNAYLFSSIIKNSAFTNLYFLDKPTKNFRLVLDYYPIGRVYKVIN